MSFSRDVIEHGNSLSADNVPVGRRSLSASLSPPPSLCVSLTIIIDNLYMVILSYILRFLYKYLFKRYEYFYYFSWEYVTLVNIMRNKNMISSAEGV